MAPGEFDGHEPFYTYLGEYGGFEAGGRGSLPHGCATYRLTVLLPQEEKTYALELPEIYSSSRVWINGSLASRLGDVDNPLAAPSVRTGMFSFQAAGQAEIVVQAADSRHYYSGMVYPPAFGSVNAVSDLISFRFLRTGLMVVSSFTVGLLYLLIGLKIRAERNRMVLFALTSFSFSLFAAYPLFHLFGAGFWSYRLEDISFYLFLTAAASLHCTLCNITGRPRRIVLGFSAAPVLLVLAVPPLLGHSLNAMLVYSLVLGCIKMILFGWLIITAMLNREQTDSMNCLLLSGLCATAAGLFCQEAAPVFEPVRFGWQTENAAFIFIILLAGGLWYDMVKASTERAVLSENIRHMKRQFSLQEENYRLISDSFEETRRMRHDLRHHMNTLRELAGHQRYKDLAEYLDGFASAPADTGSLFLCENQAAGAVLSYYRQLAMQKQVPLELKVSLPRELKLEGWNLGVLFGNLIENAIEASEKLPYEKRSVKVHSRIASGNLLISVRNNWDGNFHASAPGGQIYSSKRSGPGIGLASVRNLVNEKGGQFYLAPGDPEFEVSIVLWRQTIA